MGSEESFDVLRNKYRSSASHGEMGLVEKIKTVLSSPSEFFERIKAEGGVGGAFKYLAMLSLVNLVVGIIAFVFSIPSISSLGNLSAVLPLLGTFAAVLGIAIPVVIYVTGLILSFVGAGFVHLFAKLLKGKGDYSATYKALVYASTPSLLFGWVPWVGTIFGLYSFYLSLKGISKLHEMSMGRAFVLLFVIPLIIVFIIMIPLASLAYMYISGIFTARMAVVMSIDPSATRCASDGGPVTVYVRNDGTTASGLVSLTMTGTNAGACTSISSISAGSVATATCSRTASAAGSYRITVMTEGATSTGTVYCPS